MWPSCILLRLSLAKNKINQTQKGLENREKMPMDSTVDFSAFYRDETDFDKTGSRNRTTSSNERTRTGKFARKASRSIKQEI